MKLSILFQQCLLLLLAIFLVRGIDDTDASEATIQPLSTGETAAAFIQRKIDTHDVSIFSSTLTCGQTANVSFRVRISHQIAFLKYSFTSML